ncbi:uncharacterized protein LOC100372740 [Saccoglossus kowalevskii]
MLSSQGYFRGVDCPFYANGFCQRPYCHFRHIKKGPDSKPGSDLLQDVFGDFTPADLAGESSSKSDYTPTAKSVSPEKFTYVPTPLSECNKKKETKDVEEYDPTISSNASSISTIEKSFPEYNPTAIKKTNNKVSPPKSHKSAKFEYPSNADDFPEYDPTKIKGYSQSSSTFVQEKEEEYVPGDCNDQINIPQYSPTVIQDNKQICDSPERYEVTSNSNDFPEYVPTGIKSTKNKSEHCEFTQESGESAEYSPSDNTTNTTPASNTFPQYTPTPLSKKEPKKKSSSNKYCVNRATPVNDLEYDPLVNYSTDLKPKKSASAANNCFNELDVEATFSDDDDEEEKKLVIDQDKHNSKVAVLQTDKLSVNNVGAVINKLKNKRKVSSNSGKNELKSGDNERKGKVSSNGGEGKEKSIVKQDKTKTSSNSGEKKLKNGDKSLNTKTLGKGKISGGHGKKSSSGSKDKVHSSHQKKEKPDKLKNSNVKQEHKLKSPEKKSQEKKSQEKNKSPEKNTDAKKVEVLNDTTGGISKDVNVTKGANKRTLEVSSDKLSNFYSKKIKIDTAGKSSDSHKKQIHKTDNKLKKSTITPLGKKTKLLQKNKFESVHTKGAKTGINSKLHKSKQFDPFELSSDSDVVEKGASSSHGTPGKRTVKDSKTLKSKSSKKDPFDLSSDSDVVSHKESSRKKSGDKTKKDHKTPHSKSQKKSLLDLSDSDFGKSDRKKDKKNTKKPSSFDLFGEDSDDSGALVINDDPIIVSSESDAGYLAELRDSDVESLSDHDTYEECLHIFNEIPNKKAKKCEKRKSSDTDFDKQEEIIDSDVIGNLHKKQRLAHHARHETTRLKKVVARPHFQPSPAQVCHNRYLALQKQLSEQASTSSNTASSASASSSTASSLGAPGSTNGYKDVITDNTGSKKRMAHMPKPSPSPSQTLTKSNPKNEKRKAHIPKAITCKNPRPTIPVEYGSKVPANIRQRYLNVFIDECLKFCKTEEESYARALKEEKAMYERSTGRNVYLNLCINTVKRLRKLQPANLNNKISPDKNGNQKKYISHEAVLAGKRATQTTFTVHRSSYQSQENYKFSGAELYEKLKPYLATEKQLQENGYPRSSPDKPGTAVIMKEMKNKAPSNDSNQKICSRCGKTYLVRPGGHYITKEECIYHWGRLWKNRVGGVIESRYSCCQGDSSTKGCCVGKLHVYDDKVGNLDGFMKTIMKSPPDDGNAGIYALDCEMCYTTMGLELTRVTVVDSDFDEVYDTFVKPLNPVIDHNTRFSGITEEDLESVDTVLQDVQAVLLNKFSADTILIGHSLESDLLALKMIHSSVIDTSLVFPHRLGPPFKRALRTLMADYLKKIIQNDVGGHDSKEDAASCMQLMIWKIKEDAKTKKYL